MQQRAMVRILALVSGLTLSPSVKAAEWVSWTEDKLLGSLMAASGEFGDLQIQGGAPGQAIAAASCRADVLRPGRGEAALLHAENRLQCQVRFVGGDASGTFDLSLAQNPIHSWGNQFDHVPFALEDARGEQFFRMLKNAWQRDDHAGMLDMYFLCGPDGMTCVETYFLNRYPSDDSPAALACSHDLNGETVTKVSCVFLP